MGHTMKKGRTQKTYNKKIETLKKWYTKREEARKVWSAERSEKTKPLKPLDWYIEQIKSPTSN